MVPSRLRRSFRSSQSNRQMVLSRLSREAQQGQRRDCAQQFSTLNLLSCIFRLSSVNTFGCLLAGSIDILDFEHFPAFSPVPFLFSFSWLSFSGVDESTTWCLSFSVFHLPQRCFYRMKVAFGSNPEWMAAVLEVFPLFFSLDCMRLNDCLIFMGY